MSNKKTPIKPASKQTKDHIAYFEGKKPIGEVLNMDNGRKKLKLSPAAGKAEKKLINFTVKYEYIVLGLAVAVISALAIWLMVGSRG